MPGAQCAIQCSCAWQNPRRDDELAHLGPFLRRPSFSKRTLPDFAHQHLENQTNTLERVSIKKQRVLMQTILTSKIHHSEPPPRVPPCPNLQGLNSRLLAGFAT